MRSFWVRRLVSRELEDHEPLISHIYSNLTSPSIHLETADQRFGEFMTAFETLGGQKLLNDTLIVRTADHGDMFMAHGGQRQKPFLAYDENLGRWRSS